MANTIASYAQHYFDEKKMQSARTVRFSLERYNEDNVVKPSSALSKSDTTVRFSEECVCKLKEFGYIQDTRRPLRFRFDAKQRMFQFDEEQPDFIVFHPDEVAFAESEITSFHKRLDNEQAKQYDRSICDRGGEDHIYMPLSSDNHINEYYALSKNVEEFSDLWLETAQPSMLPHMRRLIPRSPHCTRLRGFVVPVISILRFFSNGNLPRILTTTTATGKNKAPPKPATKEEVEKNSGEDSSDDDDRPAARTSARAERAKAVKAAKAAARAAARAATQATEATAKLSLNETAFSKEATLSEPQLTPEEIEAARIAKEQEEIELERKEFEERQAKYAEHCAAAARQERLEREEKRAAAEERRRAKDAAASVAAEAAARAREEAARAREAARQEKKHGKKRN